MYPQDNRQPASSCAWELATHAGCDRNSRKVEKDRAHEGAEAVPWPNGTETHIFGLGAVSNQAITSHQIAYDAIININNGNINSNTARTTAHTHAMGQYDLEIRVFPLLGFNGQPYLPGTAQTARRTSHTRQPMPPAQPPHEMHGVQYEGADVDALPLQQQAGLAPHVELPVREVRRMKRRATKDAEKARRRSRRADLLSVADCYVPNVFDGIGGLLRRNDTAHAEAGNVNIDDLSILMHLETFSTLEDGGMSSILNGLAS